MDCYHGTLRDTAAELAQGTIDVDTGCGELGSGFYASNYLWTALAWASNRYSQAAGIAALHLRMSDSDFFSLNVLPIARLRAFTKRRQIKRAGRTCRHKFRVDVVWSPIVGSSKVDDDQYKFESIPARDLLNGSRVQRRVIE